ncbi:hypothetical protein X946_5206 [Burkholderia sp. ABCPW 111]|nr:hypothetical protein X946_5206 [Burkholderia sp. ABCPW 111]
MPRPMWGRASSASMPPASNNSRTSRSRLATVSAADRYAPARYGLAPCVSRSSAASSSRSAMCRLSVAAVGGAVCIVRRRWVARRGRARIGGRRERSSRGPIERHGFGARGVPRAPSGPTKARGARSGRRRRGESGGAVPVPARVPARVSLHAAIGRLSRKFSRNECSGN